MMITKKTIDINELDWLVNQAQLKHRDESVLLTAPCLSIRDLVRDIGFIRGVRQIALVSNYPELRFEIYFDGAVAESPTIAQEVRQEIATIFGRYKSEPHAPQVALEYRYSGIIDRGIPLVCYEEKVDEAPYYY